MRKKQPIATLRNHFRRRPRTVPVYRILYRRIPKQGRCNMVHTPANRANRPIRQLQPTSRPIRRGHRSADTSTECNMAQCRARHLMGPRNPKTVRDAKSAAALP